MRGGCAVKGNRFVVETKQRARGARGATRRAPRPAPFHFLVQGRGQGLAPAAYCPGLGKLAWIASICATTSGASCTFSAPMFSSSCASVVAPMMVEATHQRV